MNVKVVNTPLTGLKPGETIATCESRRICGTMVAMENDERFMREALKEARLAYRAGEVPVGAVLVFENQVVARGHNQVELLRDATAHAEMVCLTAGANGLGNWRLSGATLYCTLEPCSMCAGAMLLSRVSRLVFGAPDLRQGAAGSWIDLLGKPHPMHSLEVMRGLLQAESADLLRQFFAERRQALD